MVKLSSEQFQLLAQTLIDCGQFDTEDNVRAIFSHPLLMPWKTRVPEANSVFARVNAVLAYLMDKQHATTKANALGLLFQVLAQQADRQDARHAQLVQMAKLLGVDFQGPAMIAVEEEPQTTSISSVRDQADFFISYNRGDKQWAEWIAWHLEEVGYTTTIQAWDFGPGGNFVLEMQKASSHCARTIAILSPDYITSPFTQSEWAAAFARDPTGQRRELIHIRVRECELPGLLRPIVYIDLVGVDEQEAKQRLLDGVKKGRQKPGIRPAYPATKAIEDRQSPDFPGTVISG